MEIPVRTQDAEPARVIPASSPRVRAGGKEGDGEHRGGPGGQSASHGSVLLTLRGWGDSAGHRSPPGPGLWDTLLFFL